MTNKDLFNEINELHAGIMALEQILIDKKIINLDGLNRSVRKAKKEVNLSRKNKRKIYNELI